MLLNSKTPRVASGFSRAFAGLVFAIAAGTSLSAGALAEMALGQGAVFTANEEGGSMSRIDLQTGGVQTINLPVMPHNVDVSVKSGLVFVVGLAGMGDEASAGTTAGMAMGEEGGRLAVFKLDGLDRGPIAVIDAGKHPAHVIPDPDGKRVFVTDSKSDVVQAIDITTGKLIGTAKTGSFPHGLRLSPDGKEIYAADVQSDAVSVIDPATLTETARIPVGKAPVQVGFTPDGKRVYVSLRDENAVAVIDRESRQVVAKIPVGRNPIQVFVTPDGRFVYVADQGSDTDPDNRVSIIEVASNEVVKTLEAGKGAHGVTIESDGRFAFISNIKDGSVSVIDTESQSVVKTIPVGEGPNGIAFAAGNS